MKLIDLRLGQTGALHLGDARTSIAGRHINLLADGARAQGVIGLTLSTPGDQPERGGQGHLEVELRATAESVLDFRPQPAELAVVAEDPDTGAELTRWTLTDVELCEPGRPGRRLRYRGTLDNPDGAHIAPTYPVAVSGEGLTVAEALGHEDGDRWFAQGHLTPEAMVLAVVVEQMSLVGPNEAAELLTRGEPSSGLDGHFVLRGDYPTHRDKATELLGMTRHLWLRWEGDENMVPAEPDEDGAEPWTELWVR